MLPQEADLGVYEKRPVRPFLTRSLVVGSAVVLGALVCIIVVAVLVSNRGMDGEGPVEKAGAGLLIKYVLSSFLPSPLL